MQQLHWQDLPVQLRNLAPRLLQGRFNGNFQCLWAGGDLQRFNGRVSTDDLVFDLAPGRFTLDAVRSTVQWNRQQNSWRVLMRDTLLRRADQNTTIPQLSIRQLPENKYRLDLPNVQLSRAFQLWQHATSGMQTDFSNLTAVGGQISSLHAQLQPSAQGLKITDLQLDCHQCSMSLQNPDRSFPPLNGNVHWSPAGGSANLNTADSRITWPTLWKTPITLQAGQASATWQANASGWNVKVKKISLQNPELNLSGSATLQLDKKLHPGKLRILLQHSSGDIGAIRTLLPAILPAKIHRWCINALLGGHFQIDKGKIEANLKADNFFDKATVHLNARVKQGILLLVPKWPVFESVTGSLEVVNHRLNFTINTASFAKQQISRLQGSLSGLGTDKSLLSLNGQTSGEIAELLEFMKNQGLYQGAARSFLKSANGIGTLDLTLEYILGAKKAEKFSGAYLFQNHSLTLLSGPKLSAIQGKLVFDNTHIAATGLTANAFSGPLTADLFITFEPGIREINAGGEADLPALLQFMGDKFSDLGSGRLQWQGSWQGGGDTDTFTLQSTLKGVKLMLPAPLNKDAVTKWPLNIKILRRHTTQDILLDAGTILQASLHYLRKGQETRLQDANIALGTDLGEKNHTPGLQAHIIADHFNWDAWQRMLDHFSNPKSPALPIRGISIRTHNMYAMSRPWGSVELGLKPDKLQSLALTIAGDRLKGTGTYQKTSDHSVLSMDMRYFHWPTVTKTQGSNSSDPDTWPDLNLHVGDFRYGEMQLGQLNLASESHPGIFQINSLQLLRNDLMMQVEGHWKSDQNHGTTVLHFQAGSIDLGSVIDSLGFKKQLTAGVADLQGHLQWPGRPADYQIANVSGKLDFHARKGTISGVDPGGGRFLGLLNADALLQRLRLDFSDLTGEGLSYNEMEARAQLSSGNLLIDKLLIFSTLALVDMQGRIGLGTEDYDLKMTVAPQLGGNVSLISAILASPVAGVAIYLLNKVFKNQINQWLRYEYLISGDWKKPQIKKIVLQANQKEPEEFRGTR